MTRPGDATQLLSEFIKINTSNPPGNEEVAVLYLEALLKKEGIKTEIYASAPKRANLLATIKGKTSKKPIILLSHIDVVPADEGGWVEGPFSGAIRDGYIYGRGAIDMKSQVICLLLSFIELRRQGVTPERDMIFLATADEETGGKFGAEYMVEKMPRLRDASFVMSEGGCIVEEEGLLHAQVSVAEKKIAQFMIRGRGTGGHASMPHKDNANDKLVRAANRLINYSLPFKPTPIVTRYLNTLLKGKKIGGSVFSNLRQALQDKKFRDFIGNHPVYNAILRNTLTLTLMKAGEKVNVIPTESIATFDARILPEQNNESFLKTVSKVAGPEVEVISLGKYDSIPSSFKTDYFRMISDVVKGMSKDRIPVLPFLTTGATDLRSFRGFGITAYGFFPMVLSKDELFRMHGLNERISVENLRNARVATDRIVKLLASYAPL
jgi:acetylornithine deacetylase/succinyl-diaminopimelate desuccinylase-like protein